MPPIPPFTFRNSEGEKVSGSSLVQEIFKLGEALLLPFLVSSVKHLPKILPLRE